MKFWTSKPIDTKKKNQNWINMIRTHEAKCAFRGRNEEVPYRVWESSPKNEIFLIFSFFYPERETMSFCFCFWFWYIWKEWNRGLWGMREKRVSYRTGEDPGEANRERGGAKVWRNNIVLMRRQFRHNYKCI